MLSKLRWQAPAENWQTIKESKILDGILLSLHKYNGTSEISCNKQNEELTIILKGTMTHQLTLSLENVQSKVGKTKQEAFKDLLSSGNFSIAFDEYLKKANQIVEIKQSFRMTGFGAQILAVNRENAEDFTLGLFINYLRCFVMQAKKNDTEQQTGKETFLSITQLNYFFSSQEKMDDTDFKIQKREDEVDMIFNMHRDMSTPLLQGSTVPINTDYFIIFSSDKDEVFICSSLDIKNDCRKSQAYVEKFDTAFAELLTEMRGQPWLRLASDVQRNSGQLVVV